jgi:protein tyrosine phosphatase
VAGGEAAGLFSSAHQILVNRLDDPAQMEREYSHICQLDMHIPHSVEASQDDKSRAKNRYVDVLPYDYNR